MTAFKSNNGTWYCSFQIKENGIWRHITKRGFTTKKEAKEYENIIRTQQKPPTLLTFMQMVERWEKHLQCSPGSIRQHREHFNIRFAELKDRNMSDITKTDLLEWRAWLSTQPYATKTKNCTITYVKGVFKFANDLYDMPNVASVLTRLKKTNEEVMEEFDVWTPDEFNQFIEYVEDPEYQLFFKFLFWTGVRRGEAIALQKTDVVDGWANIKYSQREQCKGLQPTKTRQRRRIKLDDQLYAEIRKKIDDQQGCYVFGGLKSLTPTSIDKKFKDAIKKSGVKNIRLHDLRHSHATWLINNGVNIVAVSKRLGHTTIEQTLKTYTHLLETSDQNMLEKINEYKLASMGWNKDSTNGENVAQKQHFSNNSSATNITVQIPVPAEKES